MYITGYDDRVQVFTAKEMFVGTFGRRGEKKGELKEPRGVAIDSTGMV